MNNSSFVFHLDLIGNETVPKIDRSSLHHYYVHLTCSHAIVWTPWFSDENWSRSLLITECIDMEYWIETLSYQWKPNHFAEWTFYFYYDFIFSIFRLPHTHIWIINLYLYFLSFQSLWHQINRFKIGNIQCNRGWSQNR